MKVFNLAAIKCAGVTVQKIKIPIKDFFSKCDQIRRKLRIWSHLLKKSLIENYIFCTVGEVDLFFDNQDQDLSYQDDMSVRFLLW